MRFAFWILLVLAAILGLILAARFEAGYVLVVYPPWRVDLSLPLAVAALLLLFLAGYFLVRLLRRALLLPADMRAWRGRRRKRQADADLARAVAALLSGHDEQARRWADKARAHEPTPLSLLVAAHAASRLGDSEAARALLASLVSDTDELMAARQHLEARLGVCEAATATPGPAGA